jgi:hypothetical protein
MGRKLMALVAITAVAAMVSVGSTDTVMNGFVQQFYASEPVAFSPPIPLLPPSPVVFLLIDEDSIDNGSQPNNFTEIDVNDLVADLGLRTQLPYFASNIDETIELNTGQIGDEGWFAITNIPDSWADAGPTDDGLENFIGVNNLVGQGLGIGREPEGLLYEVPDVTPLGDEHLEMLEGDTVCALVYDGDINAGNLAGDTLGIVGFQVDSVDSLNQSSSSLSLATITILDANEVCSGPLVLFTEVPEQADNPASEPPSVVEDVPQNSTESDGVAQNATDIGGNQNSTDSEVPQNATQTEPVPSNSSGVSDEQPNDSTGDGAADESTAGDVPDDSTEDSGSSAKEEESETDGSDNGTDKETSEESGSEDESGDEESSSEESSTEPNPSEEPPRVQ